MQPLLHHVRVPKSKKGLTTWADLERLNLAAPPKKAAFGSGEAGVFTKALEAAKLADKKD